MNACVKDVHGPVLIIFAKVPIAGKVKTRLSPPLSAEQAASVAKLCLEHLLSRVCYDETQAWPGRIELWLGGGFQSDALALQDINHFLLSLESKYAIKIRQQCEGDLGQKMFHAFNETQGGAFDDQPAAKALIVGADIPHIDLSSLKKAYQQIQQGHNIIAATEDGGYYMVSVNVTDKAMFDGVRWGSEHALADTLFACERVGVQFEMNYPIEFDIDTHADVVKLAKKDSTFSKGLLAHGITI